MDFNYIGCEKRIIDGIHREVHRNVLIQEYCSQNFYSINLVDFYYRTASQNAFLMFIFIFLVFPFLFKCLIQIAEKYLAEGMEHLVKKFKMSPSLAASTLIAFASGTPDVISTFYHSGSHESLLLGLSSVFACYVFGTCFIVSFISFTVGKDIKLPKWSVIKEFSFYLASILVIIIFGLFKTAGYPLLIIYIGIYILYLVATILLDLYGPKENEGEEIEKDLERKLGAEDIKEQDHESQKALEKNKTLSKIESEIEKEESEAGEKNSENTKEGKEKGIFQQIIDEIIFKNNNTFFEELFLVPLLFLGLFTVCYSKNPLMKIMFLRFIIISISTTFTLTLLQWTPLGLLINSFIGLSVGFFFFILEYIWEINQTFLNIVYEFFSIFAGMAWITIFSTIIIDFVCFMAFYFSINEVILSSLVLSVGNMSIDLFGLPALAKAGETVMAVLSSYSTLFFANMVGYSICIYYSIISDYKEFDIFALDYYKVDKHHSNTQHESHGNQNQPPYGNYYFMMILGYILFINIMCLAYYIIHDFTLTKKLSIMLIVVYASFFIGSIGFGILSSPDLQDLM